MNASPPKNLLRHLGYALCEDRAGHRFVLLADPPAWFQDVWGPQAAGDLVVLGERAPFLEAFLSEAAEHWGSDAETPLTSGVWVERGSSGREVPLEATAWRLDGRRILSIESPRQFEQHTRVLQIARDSALAHERLLKEIQKKEILLHCIIHDLSQPLAAIRGCFDILSRDATSPASKRLIGIGKQQSERQDGLIREVLQAFAADLQSAMASGESASSWPDIFACAEQTVAAFAPVFQSRGAAMRLDPRLDRAAAWTVAGERSRLLRIFSNLAENALRHAPSGSTVTIGLSDDGGHVKAFVDDEGPGLPKDFQPSEAFALFSKGKQGGGKAGLGLYFCRITIERWGGSIGCESLPQRGARFWFRLPRAARAESAAAPAPAASAQPRRHAHLKILLVEDDPAVRELSQILIEREGHKVVAVASGSEALRTLAKQKFDVVFLDEEMPGMSGVEVAAEIRAAEAATGAHQLLFALTGNSAPEDQKRLLASGFDTCFGKPFRAEELREAAGRFRLGSTAESQKHAKPAPAGAGDPLLARVGGDKKLLQSIVRTFLKDYPEKLRKIRLAISRKNAPSLASAAHALKGAVAIFGPTDALDRARELQDAGRRGDLSSASSTLRKLNDAIARLDAKLREYAATASRTPSDSGRTKRAARKSNRRAIRGPRRR